MMTSPAAQKENVPECFKSIPFMSWYVAGGQMLNSLRSRRCRFSRSSRQKPRALRFLELDSFELQHLDRVAFAKFTHSFRVEMKLVGRSLHAFGGNDVGIRKNFRQMHEDI